MNVMHRPLLPCYIESSSEVVRCMSEDISVQTQLKLRPWGKQKLCEDMNTRHWMGLVYPSGVIDPCILDYAENYIFLKGNACKWHKKDLDTHLSGRVRMQHMQRSGFYYQHYKITKWKYKAGLPNTILIIYCFLTLLMIPCFVVPGYYMIVGHMSSAFDSHNYHRTVNNLKIR